MSSSSDLVRIVRTGHICELVLNAPERLNALNWELVAALESAVTELRNDTECRAVVVTGEGRGFCAGADARNLFGDITRPTQEIEQDLRRVYASFMGLRELTVPTIAAVHGPAIGAGLGVALACDVILGGPRATFGATVSAIGLHPGGGCTWLLTERLGRARAGALLLEGRVLKVEEAFRIGLVDRLVDDPLAEGRALAETLGSREPRLMAEILDSVDLASKGDFDSSLDREARRQAESVGREAFATFLANFAAR